MRGFRAAIREHVNAFGPAGLRKVPDSHQSSLEFLHTLQLSYAQVSLGNGTKNCRQESRDSGSIGKRPSATSNQQPRHAASVGHGLDIKQDST